MHSFSSPFGACTQCTFNYGPKCRFLWLQIRIFPTPKMRLFPASALMALGCWHRWLCDYSELSEWEPPTKAPGLCQGPRSASNALPVPQNTTSGQESKPNQNQNSVFPQHTVRCQLRLRTNEFFCSEDHAACCPLDMVGQLGWRREVTAGLQSLDRARTIQAVKYSRDKTLWKTDRLVCVTPADLTGRAERQRKDG